MRKITASLTLCEMQRILPRELLDVTRLIIASEISLSRINLMELIREDSNLKDVKPQVRERAGNAVL